MRIHKIFCLLDAVFVALDAVGGYGCSSVILSLLTANSGTNSTRTGYVYVHHGLDVFHWLLHLVQFLLELPVV